MPQSRVVEPTTCIIACSDLEDEANLAAPSKCLSLFVISGERGVRKCALRRTNSAAFLAGLVFAWFAAIDHVRFMFLAAVIVMPILAVDFERSFCAPSDQKGTTKSYGINPVAGTRCSRSLKAPVCDSNAGIMPVDSVQRTDGGNFVHIMDPEGNKIELWEPKVVEVAPAGMVTTR